MKAFMFALLALILAENKAAAQGTINIALQQQFAFSGCSSAANVCGTPLIGGLLYFYQVGTVATPQDSFQDTGLTIKNVWPLALDANGRVPMFYLASGSIHVRLTDAGGVVQFDYPSMLVVGPSGGGGGGGAVDPTTIAQTGDIKWRPTSETLTGWVKANSTTIGNATSSANQRAAADTQNLFIYLWTNCTQAHCPVRDNSGTIVARGGSALTDFSSSRQITVYDMRGRGMFGVDDMGTTAAGRLLAQNITGAGDTVTTPAGIAGENNHTLLLAELASHTHQAFISDPGHIHSAFINETPHTHSYTTFGSANVQAGGGATVAFGATGATTGASSTGLLVWDGATNNQVALHGSNTSLVDGLGHNNLTQPTGGGGSHNVVNNSLLGTWYLKL